MATQSIAKPTRRLLTSNCDIYQENGNIVLRLEMPGVNKENLNIKIDGDLLIIHAAKAEIPAGGKYIMREIRDGDYYHKYTLDQTIDRNKIEASLEKGVLYLTLKIKESEKPRKIKVIAK